jgi:uncharacterized phage protein (TIGR02218 family)
MRAVNPPSATAALMALLDTDQFEMADLFTFSLRSGTVLRYTSADMTLTVNGNTYSATGPLIARGATKNSVGLEVDVLDLKVQADATHLVDGVPFVRAALTGVLDGAEVTLERAFGPAWGQPMVASITLFVGRMGSPEYDNGLSIPVKSHTELLDTAIPRNVYQPACLNTLYDAGCGVDRLARTEFGTVTGGTTSSITTDLNARPDGYFALGVFLFTSGVNSGVQRSVKWDASGRFDFALPLPKAPAAGDTFSVVPGCDRSKSTCESKFNNIIRFRGQPFIPSPETSSPG